MNSVVLYYLKNNIYIQNNDKYREMFTTVTHDKKLYLISAYCYNKRAYPGIQSILNLKDKNSIVLMMVSVNIKYRKKYVIK